MEMPFYKIHLRGGKLDQGLERYYRIVEQTGSVPFVIWDQMAGRVKRTHANNTKLTEVNDWKGTESRSRKRKMRKATPMEPEEMETDKTLERKRK